MLALTVSWSSAWANPAALERCLNIAATTSSVASKCGLVLEQTEKRCTEMLTEEATRTALERDRGDRNEGNLLKGILIGAGGTAVVAIAGFLALALAQK